MNFKKKLKFANNLLTKIKLRNKTQSHFRIHQFFIKKLI